MNLFTKQKQTHRHKKQTYRKQTYGYQRGKGEERGINQEFGINRYTLQYIKQKNNKDLLYSTVDHCIALYIQYTVITYNRKETEKEQLYTETYIYMYN